MRPAVAVALISSLLGPTLARALDLPVRDGRHAVRGPAYAGDRIEVRLAPAAARGAWTARAAGATRVRAVPAPLGVAALDAAAAGLGAWFEPEFRGETPPSSASTAPDFTAFYLAHVPAGTDLESALERLRALPEVRSAEPIAVLPVSVVPDDSLWSGSWWYQQPAGHDIHAPAAWDVTTGDTTLVVAILDTGVLRSHPDLGGRVAGAAGQIWTNWAEQGGVPGVDDDGNGFVDDTWGWDFVDLPSGGNVPPFEDWQDADNDPDDYAGHGTLVAGLTGALTDDGIGVAGTAWRVRLMPLRIGWAEAGAPLGLVDMSYVAQAVRYATRMRADVINCSFASLDLSGLGEALDAAVRAGVTVVAAAGNNGAPSYIGMREDVIAVGASGADDRVASFSTTGSWVDLVAPGVGIYSTFVGPGAAPNDSLGYRQPGYDAPAGLDGTSFAAPLVAGAAALLEARQKALGLRPLPPRGVLLRLRETADDIAALNPGGGFGTGRLDLLRALTDPPTSTAWRTGAASVGPGVPLPLDGPARKLAWAMSDGQLLIQDWLTGDTLALSALPGPPARQLAAADLGGGRGVGLFIGTTNGWIAGFDTSGAVLPGFPIDTQTGSILAGGPALGDLDGDGTLEIVCGANDGSLWAWHADGTPLDAAPFATDGSGVSAPVALTELDGRPGVEVVAVSRDGKAYAYSGDGRKVKGWPVTVNPGPVAPVVARFGRDTAVCVAAGSQVFVLRPNGTVRALWSLSGTVVRDPALGDLDGGGTDELLLALSPPSQVVALDSAGVAPAGLGWPGALDATPLGSPVLGHLRGDGAQDLLILQTGGLVALGDSAQRLARFEMPGGAGAFPTLADLRGDGRTRIAAGTGYDSLLYVYDAGAGSAASAAQAWPTPRGNLARTGSHLYLSADALAPARVDDLLAERIAADSVRLSWTAPGDDGRSGTAALYELRTTTARAAIGTWGAGTTRIALADPDPAGVSEGVTLGGATPGVTAWYWLRALDGAGNAGRGSNVVEVAWPLGPPLPDGPALAVRQRPSRVPVLLDWTGRDAAGIRLYDVTGRLVRALGLVRGARGSAEWNGRDESGRLVPAGLYFARLTGGSIHAQTRIVLLP